MLSASSSARRGRAVVALTGPGDRAEICGCDFPFPFCVHGVEYELGDSCQRVEASSVIEHVVLFTIFVGLNIHAWGGALYLELFNTQNEQIETHSLVLSFRSTHM